MKEVEMLRALKECGISIALLAQECNCSRATIINYINGASLPTGTKQILIRDGLKNFVNKLTAIVEE